MSRLWRAFSDPGVSKNLLREDGEYIVDEVRHHWIVYVRAGLEALVGVGFLVLFLYTPVDAAWLPLLIAFAIFLRAAWLALDQFVDRFVITNMRVFRVQGILTRTQATMPLRRILDITVEIPPLGRLPFLDFGHFVFESAAQEQGLRDIRYVGHPRQRDLTIQQVVQRAGLRGSVGE